ncbi:MAG TPA: hypothetical protein ENJ79_05860 [Gammaproteobacteria bacterium]|nr:hypothetical protein [Gammaproteobacteria bacterium]
MSRMHRARLLRAVIGLATGLLLASRAYGADMTVIELQHRPADEILPLLRPMLEQGESLSGKDFALILKATPAREARLRELIRQLDTAPAELMVSVFQGSEYELRHFDIQASVRAGGNQATTGRQPVGGNSATLTLGSTHSHHQEAPLHRLRVTEGQPGYIETGREIPYFSGRIYTGGNQTLVEPGTRFKPVTTGFYVLARVGGDEAVLDISPRREQLDDRRTGQIRTRQAGTRVRVPIGQWVSLGGARETLGRRHEGIGDRYSTRARENSTLWIRIDRVHDKGGG